MAAKSHFVPKLQISIFHLFLDRSESNLRQNVCFDQLFSLYGTVVEYCVSFNLTGLRLQEVKVCNDQEMAQSERNYLKFILVC